MNGTALINAGDVIEVQLTSETVVVEGRSRAHAEPGHIINRMRIFLKEIDGRETKYDFEETELGVRESQRIAVVRAKLKKVDEPINLILFNLSSGEKDIFPRGLKHHLGYTPFFGARWKAFVLSLGMAIVFYLVSHYIVRHGQGAITSWFLAVMFAFLAFPLFWWLAAIWDAVTERIRYARVKKQFIAEWAARARAYAPGAQTTPPAATPAATPEPPPAPSF